MDKKQQKKLGPDYNLLVCHPEIAAEWDYEANGDFTPADFYAHSPREAAWIGKDCRHSWTARITNRTSNGNGCRICGGKEIIYENSLAAKFPEIAAEWHRTKNGGKTPEKVFPFSTEMAYWINETRGVFETKIVNRTTAFVRAEKRRIQSQSDKTK